MKLSTVAIFILIFIQATLLGQAPDIIMNSIIPDQTSYCSGDSVTINFSLANFAGSNSFTMSMSKSAFAIDSTTLNSVTVTGSPASVNIGYRFKNQDVDVDSAYNLRVRSGATVSLLFAGPFIVNPKPVATASVISQTVCSGVAISPITFGTSNNVSNTTFSWSRNNTTNVSGPASGTGDITFTYLVNNTSTNQTVTYTIVPTGPAPSSCAGSAITSIVIVKPAPVITIVTEDTICSGGGFSLAYTSNIPATFFWFATDNANTTGEDLSLRTINPLRDTIANLTTIDQLVTYYLVGTSTAGNCQGAEVYLNITVSPPLDAAFTVSDTTPCSADTVNFALNDTSAINSLIWIWGDGSSNTNCTGCFSVKHKYSSTVFPSVRTAQLIAINTSGCRDTSRTTINVKPNPRPNFIVNDNTQCLSNGSNQFALSDRSTIADSLSNPLSYLWNFYDASPLETTEDASHSYAVADSYFVYHSVSTSFGCIDSVSKLMIVYSDPQTQIRNSIGTDTLCGGTTIILTADSGYTYLWSNGRTTRNISVRDTVLPNSYTVIYSVTATDNHSCTATGSKEITINPPLVRPEITFDTSLTFCAGAKAQLFQISDSVNATYVWNSIYTGAQFNTDLPSLPGDTFPISVQATDNVTGCTSSDTATIYLSKNTAPTANVVLDLVTLICTNNTVNEYQWGYDDVSLQEQTLSGETLQSYYAGSNPEFAVSGKYYWVKITDAGGCQSKIYYQSPPGYYTSISSFSNQDITLRVYPNPVYSLFKVEIPDYRVDVKTIEVYNIRGQLILKESFHNNMIIEAYDWNGGMYFLKAITGNGVYKIQRLIKL